MSSELTDEQVRNAVERAELDAEVVATPHPYRVASMLGRELLAARMRIATLERDLADARAKLATAWLEGYGACALDERHPLAGGARPNPYAPAGEKER